MLDKFILSSVPRAIVLYGECEFLFSYYANLILSKLDSNPKIMYFDYNHDEAVEYLSTNNLFGGRNVLVLKVYKIPTQKEIKELFFILEQNKNSFLIIELYKSSSSSNTDYAREFQKASGIFKPSAKLKDVFDVRFFEPSFDEKIKILTQRITELNIYFDFSMLQHLLDTQNGDLGMAYNELSKFIYYQNITHELIDELCYGLGELKIESLLNSLFDKKGNLVSILNTLNEEGFDNMKILLEINRYFYILFKLYGHSKMYGNMDSKSALGYSPPKHIFNVWSRRSLKIKTQTFLALFDILNEWRVGQIKGKNVALQYLIAIQQIL